MADQSAIIIPIPEVEPIVGPLRVIYDLSAKLGVPAHVTLLYPFYPAHTVNDEIETLRKVCASIESFSFLFREVRRFPKTAYLYPDKSESFAQITKTLAENWRGYEPYGGNYATFIPHLTFADQVDSEIIDNVEEIVQPQLPIMCAARELWLIASDHAGMWSTKAVFSLPKKKGSSLK